MYVARSGSSPFARVDRRGYGYDVRQVDRFLATARDHYDAEELDGSITSSSIRATSFDPVRGGYEPQAVDAALDRLEDVFARRERDHLIGTEGEDAWLRHLGRTAAVLLIRLRRPPGERFGRPTRKRTPSYDIDDVDGLCDQLLRYFENDQPLSVDTVRRAVFHQARGADGYEEDEVDAFLDRVVGLMAGID